MAKVRIWFDSSKILCALGPFNIFRFTHCFCAVNLIIFHYFVLCLQQSNRVTLKMEVSYTDHSHIIGRGGSTISRVREETSCHIHFPDLNRTNQTEKSNLVTVAGELTGVEMARARIRVITPIKLILLYLVSLSCWQIWRVLFWRRLCNRILDQLTTMLANSKECVQGN